jgi:hypothetical protein
MKKALALAIAAFVLAGWAEPLIAADTTPSPGTPVACPVIGAVRELGLLVLGIGWEAIRIVLPDSCPEKQKDIDGLLKGREPDRELSP